MISGFDRISRAVSIMSPRSLMIVVGMSAVAACDSDGPLVATHLGFAAQPEASVVSTQPLGSIEVAFLNADGHVVTDVAGNVHLSLVSADTSAHLSGTVSAEAVAGVAVFSGLSVDRAGSYTLAATANGVDRALSQTFSITVGAPSGLRFGSLNALHVAGATLRNVAANSVTVSVTDAGDNTVSNATGPITIMLGDNEENASLVGTTTVSAISGTGTFTDLNVQKSGTYTLIASGPALASATSAGFIVQSAAMTQVIFTKQPSNGTVGVPLPSFTARISDAYGNPTSLPPGGSLTMTVALGNNPTSAVLSGTLTVSGLGAVGSSFTNVSIDKAGTGYTLIVSTPGFANVTSSPFNIVP
jgi:hypothetical protein